VLYPSCFSGCCCCREHSSDGGGAVALPLSCCCCLRTAVAAALQVLVALTHLTVGRRGAVPLLLFGLLLLS
jgi:hypothetical protein